MAEPEAVEPTADRGSVHHDAVKARQFQAQLIQGQITPLRQTPAPPIMQSVQLARPPQIALRFRQKRARFPAKLDHVVDEFRRHTEMPGRLPVTMPFVNISDDTLS